MSDNGNSRLWIYSGISVAIIIGGLAIFFFAIHGNSSQANAPKTATSTSAQSTSPIEEASPFISVGIQNTNSSSQGVVVQWANLPSGTTAINVFHSNSENGTSVLVGNIKIPTSSFLLGSSSFIISSTTQKGYYYGVASGTPSSTPPSSDGDQGSGSSTDGNPPSQGGGTPSSTPSSTPPSSDGDQGSGSSTDGNPPSQGGGTPSSSSTGNYFACVVGQCVATSTPGATSCETACSGVSVAGCSPSTISLTQTSQCSLDLNSVTQSDIVWTVASGSTGSVNVDGVYTPSATGTETIIGTLPDNTSAESTVTVAASSSSQGGSGGGSSAPGGSSPIQSSLTWNGNNYSVEDGLYTLQDMVYITSSTSNSISSIKVYCSYSQYSGTPQSLGNGNYEIGGLSSHGCNTPNSINYLDLGGFYGNGLNISINAPQ